METMLYHVPFLGTGEEMKVEDIKKICVLGAGTMGAGIAQLCSVAGYKVTMRDIEQKFVDAGFARISGPLGKRVAKGKMTQEDVDKILDNVEGTTDVAGTLGVGLRFGLGRATQLRFDVRDYISSFAPTRRDEGFDSKLQNDLIATIGLEFVLRPME